LAREVNRAKAKALGANLTRIVHVSFAERAGRGTGRLWNVTASQLTKLVSESCVSLHFAIITNSAHVH